MSAQDARGPMSMIGQGYANRADPTCVSALEI